MNLTFSLQLIVALIMSLINAFYRNTPTTKSTRSFLFMQIAQRTKKAATEVTIDPLLAQGRTLVIVESPAKAKTIEKFLNSLGSNNNFIIDYSAGHIRELISKVEDVPKDHVPYTVHDFLKIKSSTLGIDVNNNFKPLYKVIDGKKSIITRLKSHAQKVDRILFATDEDREGEAISWHLLDVLKPKIPYKRAVFHEITKPAIIEAFRNPRDIDMNLVNAQEARSLLDKLTGYTLSPLLWKYLFYGLSAGRVQSCGLQLIAEREKQRWKFVPSNYYSIQAYLSPVNVKGLNDQQPILTKLTKWNGAKVATEKDFDGSSGKIKNNQTVVLDEEKSQSLMRWLTNADGKSKKGQPIFTIADRSEKSLTQHPSVPYITSSLQQDASRKLGLSPARTMAIAQRLYESGQITYMRTDSPTLSTAALDAIKDLITSQFGENYLGTRVSKGSSGDSNSPKNAQEAHEAIRPALIDDTFRTSAQLGLQDQEAKLYDLIYKRTIASQMKESKSLTVSYVIDATDREHAGQNATFRFAQTKLQFDGFLVVWGRSSKNDGLENRVIEALMNMKVGQELTLFEGKLNVSSVAAASIEEEAEEVSSKEEAETQDEVAEPLKGAQISENYPGILSTPHVTRAPSRFTEAAFIEELESVGVGRPSTYATILQILKDREYIVVDKRSIIPTLKGIFVSDFLQRHFSEFTNEQFTAEMEKALDSIAHGKLDKQSFIKSFYLGEGNEKNRGKASTMTSSSAPSSPLLLNGLLKMINDKIESNVFQRKAMLEIPYLKDIGSITARGTALYLTNSSSSSTSSELFVHIPSEIQDVRQLTRENILELVESYQGNLPAVNLGDHPKLKKPVQLKIGRFGKYLEVSKSKKASIPKWMSESDVTLQKALQLLELPIVIAKHPELQRNIELNCNYGELAVNLEGDAQRLNLPEGYWIDDIIQNKDNLLEATIYSKLKELSEKELVGYWKNIPSEFHWLIFEAEVKKTTKKEKKGEGKNAKGDDEGEDRAAKGMAVTFHVGRFGPYLKCGKLNCALNAKTVTNKDDIGIDAAIERLQQKCERTIKKNGFTSKDQAEKKMDASIEEIEVEEETEKQSRSKGRETKETKEIESLKGKEAESGEGQKPKRKAKAKITESAKETAVEKPLSKSKPRKAAEVVNVGTETDEKQANKRTKVVKTKGTESA